ncbi:MAG: hypothetical protein HKN09_05740 [Saprospiraceae bacterium]|nr:hypothetical protein [Saprospiraceae bacterium]
MKYIISLLVIGAFAIGMACIPSEEAPSNKNPILSEIWYKGKAEISSFELKQNRYDGLHDGEMVMIFVTEDFLPDKQVKNDSYTSDNSVPVIKNNRIRKFTTGVYDYSIYTSVFTDVSQQDEVNTYKVTMSSQDWCGQSCAQLNNVGRYNKVSVFSYFEKEGDSVEKLKDVLLIDEVFNLIRLGESYLPVGTVEVMPPFLFSRLKHVKEAVYSAEASLLKTDKGQAIYTIVIPKLDYTLEIEFNMNAQRDILSIKESYPSAFDGKLRTTVATRKNIQWLDYWNKNGVEDDSLRAQFNLN